MWRKSEKFKKIAKKVIEEHENLRFINKIAVGFVETDKSKHEKGKIVRAECKLVKESDILSVFAPFEYIIIVYLPNIEGFTDKQLYILMYHELLHIGYDHDLIDHDVYIADFKEIVEQYGYEWDTVG